MTLEDWKNIAQIVVACVAIITLVVSLRSSSRALREINNDRNLNHQPFLLFRSGGFRIPVRFVKAGGAIPGIHPSFAKALFSHLDKDAESIRIDDETFKDTVPYADLHNIGNGTAIAVHVTWIPKVVKIGDDVFVIDEEKLKEPKYCNVLNRMPIANSFFEPWS